MNAVTLNLESAFYHDPAIFAAERDAIFARGWQLVAHETRLPNPGDYLATRLAGTNIFLRRGADGQLRGFTNVCRHRGAKLLGEGVGNCGEVRCPYHNWLYDDHGRLTDTPWFGETSPFELERWPLHPVQLQTWRGLVFAALAPEVPLVEQLGDLPDEVAKAPLETFVAADSQRFDASINWKTYIDQFVENYHVPPTHSPDKAVAIETFTCEPKRGMMVITAPVARSYGGRWIWGWPNWTVSLFEGGMKTSRVNPVSAVSCEVYFDYYFADRSAGGEPQRRRIVDATESIFREDVAACERAQASYSSGSYTQGPLHPHLEKSVAYFQKRVRAALGKI